MSAVRLLRARDGLDAVPVFVKFPFKRLASVALDLGRGGWKPIFAITAGARARR